MGLRPQDPDTLAYEKTLVAAYGEKRKEEILSTNIHHVLIYPGLSVQSPPGESAWALRRPRDFGARSRRLTDTTKPEILSFVWLEFPTLINAHVFNEHMSSIVGDVPPEVALPQVWLDDDADQARAMAVLRDYHIGRNRTGVLFCPKCREENPATFEICWKYGMAI